MALVSLTTLGLGCQTHATLDLLDDAGDASGGFSTGGSDAQGGSGGSDAGGTDAGGSGGGDSGGGGGETSLVHRYSFSEPGSIAFDSVGAEHGEVFRGAGEPPTVTAGSVVLDGVDDYVWLPDGLISKLHSATLIIWASWSGTTAWHRLWDFGNTRTVGTDTKAERTFFLTPLEGGATGPATFLEFHGEFKGLNYPDLYLIANDATAIAAGEGHQYAVVVDEELLDLRLYVDGLMVGEQTLEVEDTGVYYFLSDLPDNNNSLGRSQYAVDPYFDGTLSEFRIYDKALSAEEVMATYEAGPDNNPVP